MSKGKQAAVLLFSLCLILSGCGKKSGSDTAASPVEKAAGAVLSFFNGSGGAAAEKGRNDVPSSPYFAAPDVYHMKNTDTRIILEHYRTYQQTTGYTCGPAAALTVVEHFLGKPKDSEMEMAKIMDTHTASMKDPGTNTRNMSRYFQKLGWTVHNSLKDGSPETYGEFIKFVRKNLSRGVPILVENVDLGGHWRVIIGLDEIDKDHPANDVLILADPYDTTDHRQDGYHVTSAYRFYHMWFDALLFRRGEKIRQWLTAEPPGYGK